jgi:hypothetical protein
MEGPATLLLPRGKSTLKEKKNREIPCDSTHVMYE